MSSVIGFVEIVVLIVNICMKVAGAIDWSWWTVLWPLWLDVILSILAILKAIVNKWTEDMRY